MAYPDFMGRYIFIIIFFVLSACQKEPALGELHLAFDQTGEHLLSGLKVNDTLKFAGSNGSSREYRVFKIERSKQTVQDCNWNTGYCNIFYTYDRLQVYFVRTDSIPLPPNSSFTYSLTLQMQLPAAIDKNNIPRNVKPEVHLFGNAFIDYNKVPEQSNNWTTPYINYPDFYSDFQTISFSNAVKTYHEVVMIKSGNNEVYTDPLYGTRFTINEVWFDKKNGFVLFKDVFGNTWSRIN
ncbi:MAG: hypothetical protein MUE99_04440 [Chitinophagaceae bacterium]|jgi:hypothetical protein|nr:hypothetical protein [Chitinophagaceae bacterium]